MNEKDVVLLSNNEKNSNALKYKAFFNKITKNLLTELKDETNKTSSLYKKYPRERVLKMLEYPYRYEKQIRELSSYLYLISSNYKRLNEYISSILLYNYIITPTQLTTSVRDLKKYKEEYYNVVNLCEKYNFKQEARKAINIAVRDGVFYGLAYEASNSFYIRPINSNYAKITSIEDGCFVFAIDMSYFSKREYLIPQNDMELIKAYNEYKNDRTKRYFEPTNGICIKADQTLETHSFPLFIGLLANIYDIEEYAVIQKIKSKNEIYKAVVMKMETDEMGIPKMDDDMSSLYYEQAANNIADNVGIIMSPFEVDSLSFNTNSASDRNAVTDAENDFWYKAGVSPLIFGAQKATSQGSLLLSVKPDEELAFGMLQQFERYFNLRLKKMNMNFKVSFLLQSVFNADEVANRYHKASTYGVGGAKLKYAAAMSMTPSDVIGLSFIEDHVLEIGTKMFTKPLISSNTLSNGNLDNNEINESGRPTNESKGIVLSDGGEKSQEKK